jgi:hypothetical protein
MHQDTFMNENKAEAAVLVSITVDKHACRMVEHAQCMAELGLKKQQMELEATRKQLEAKDRQIATQHEHEHEKEQHNMQMLCLHLQYQGGSGVTGCATPTSQFGLGMDGLVNPSACGDIGTEMGGSYLR